MIKKCLAALGIGCLVTIWFLHYDPRIQERIGSMVLQSMQKAFDCQLQGHITSLELYTPSLEFEDVYANAINNSWSWYAQRLKITCSWLDLLIYGIVSLYIEVYGCRADSAWHGTSIGLMEFIDKLRKTTPLAIPIVLKTLRIHQAYIDICDTQQDTKITYNLACNLKRIGRCLKAILQVHDMYVKKHDARHLYDGQGTIAFQADVVTPSMVSCSVDYRYLLDACPNLVWIARGAWNGTQGMFQTKSTDDLCYVTTTMRRFDDKTITGSIDGHGPISLLGKIMHHTQLSSLDAQLTVHGTIKKSDHVSAQGWIQARNISYKGKHLVDVCTTSLDLDNALCSGSLSLLHDARTVALGMWHYDTTHNSGMMHIQDQFTNTITQGWHIQPQSTTIDLAFAHNVVDIAYKSCLAHATTQEQKNLTGTCHIEHNNMLLAGSFDNFLYHADVLYRPTFWLRSFSIKKTDCPYITIACEHPRKIQAQLDLTKCMHILHEFNPTIQIQADGMLELKGLIRHNQLYGALALHDGAIRTPHLYNVIKDIAARFVVDLQKNNLELRDVYCNLHRGTITCKRACLWWRNNGELALAHVPILLNNCFINRTKDFFAIFSGYLVAAWDAQLGSSLKGLLFIDKAQLKYNLFSSQLSQRIFGSSSSLNSTSAYDLACDIAIHTKDPLRVKTMFLETDAKIALQVTGSLQKPTLLGSIELLSGEFMFPYKPLFITKGSIIFSPHSADPTIALFAKNSIKRYHVNLHVTGMLNNPQVLIESSPSLTEEQILALLLVGTEQDSLSFVVPAIIANNLKNLIFSSDQSFSSVEQYMHRFLKPLRYIHVMPSFVDQSGRGGLRGALEVEVSDRLRAYLQKNFSLTEDARVEIEYALSDEISVKGVRDEHGDMGAEVEMRWKF